MTLKKSEKKGEVGTTRFREEKALITFLKRTKEGEYAKIEIMANGLMGSSLELSVF